MSELRVPLSLTRNVPKPTEYVYALDGECRDWAYNEERAILNKGKWREEFQAEKTRPLDLEIGTGNGFFFAHQASVAPERLLVGIEIKYKPLIQTIRRARAAECTNAKVMRYNANFVEHLFAENEIDNIYIHHPDPWPKKTKKRTVKLSYLEKLYKLQKPGSLIEFKTDSGDYFDEVVEAFEQSPYELLFKTYDLHNSEIRDKVFKTHFEKIFLKQDLPIYYIQLRKLQT